MATKKINARVRDDYLELVQRFPLKPIRTKGELAAAHQIIDELSLMGEGNLSIGQMDYLLVLGDQTSRYEDKSEANDAVSGLDVLKHLMVANDLTASDIGRIIGQRELGSKVLRGDRAISKSHAVALGDHFGLAAEIFLRVV